jgi:4-carboxymuconolactone decarboxylase
MKRIAGFFVLISLTAFSLTVWAQEMTKDDAGVSLSAAMISKETARPVYYGSPDHFTGKVTVAPLFAANPPSRASGASVTFEPGAHSAWHAHPVGQTLVVTGGAGYVQFWGGPVREIKTGDVVWIPPGQKHWHGATATSAMTHLAIQEALDGKTVDWMESVGDNYPSSGKVNATTTGQATRAQQLMGDIAPKLAQLTDDVLYRDIWERPQLSPRDRSLITVSALIAMNRPDQLRSHLALARRNGVTQDELIETITHLAFYTGWPNAVSAIAIARDVFQTH